MTIHAQTVEKLASQRVHADADLVVGVVAGRTRLRRLHQRGAAKIRLPRLGCDPLEAVLINTAGGLTGGDRIGWRVAVGDGAAAVVTTQASEKVYRAAVGRAEVEVRLDVASGARLAWLPQETIVFDRASFRRHLDVELAADARLLLAETTVFGRTAMGERVRQGLFRDRWRVRVGGGLVHAEDFAIGPDVETQLGWTATLGGAAAMATVLLISSGVEALVDPARAIIGDEGGVSAWTVAGSGKLLARLYAVDSYLLRKRLMPLLALLNEGAALPKAWSL
ncbi:MAG: urease accessory protein UreD [Rhizobiaceae bacterium]|nr:urease accessory protein UreD [Rhizobiaceae bacterium]